MTAQEAKMEKLATGYGLIEGPVYDPTRGLLFSDVINGGIYCLSLDSGEVHNVIPKRRGVGGMVLHENGGIVHGGKDIALTPDRHGGSTVLLDKEVVSGIIGFNDMTTDAKGRIFVGSLAFMPLARDAEPKPGYLHLIDLDGSSRVVAEGIQLTNGLGVSPDGRRLYHSDSLAHVVWQYPLEEDGGVGERSVFAEVKEGIPDGLAVSEDGAVWVAVAHGGCVKGFEPSGSLRMKLEVPMPMVTSVCFGGPGLNDLFIVTGSDGSGAKNRGSIYRLPAPVPGLSVSPARVAMN